MTKKKNDDNELFKSLLKLNIRYAIEDSNINIRMIDNRIKSYQTLIGHLEYNKPFFFQKSRPFFVQQSAIGLDGIADAHTFGTKLFYLPGKMLKIGKSRHGGFTTLKREAHHSVRVNGFKYLPNQGVGQRIFHDAHAVLAAVLCLVLIEAIFASEVTQAGCRFDQQIHKFHEGFSLNFYVHIDLTQQTDRFWNWVDTSLPRCCVKRMNILIISLKSSERKYLRKNTM